MDTTEWFPHLNDRREWVRGKTLANGSYDLQFDTIKYLAERKPLSDSANAFVRSAKFGELFVDTLFMETVMPYKCSEHGKIPKYLAATL